MSTFGISLTKHDRFTLSVHYINSRFVICLLTYWTRLDCEVCGGCRMRHQPESSEMWREAWRRIPQLCEQVGGRTWML